MELPYEQSEASQDVGEPPQIPPRRPYRAKGPTLGKGKACEYCRYRRIRCSGVRPICQNCKNGNRECVYLDKPRASTSTTALEARLADLEERYRVLSELEGASGAGETSASAAESARNWVSSLGLSEAAPLAMEQSEFISSNDDDPWLERRMHRSDRVSMLKLYRREAFRYGVTLIPSNLIEQMEDPDQLKRPHPCLLNAIILIAKNMATLAPTDPLHETGALAAGESNFLIPPSTPSDEELLARTQAHCAESLGDVDRLQDHLQAMLLISYWFLRKGRLMEGQYSFAVACRLIIDCKLHQIDGKVMQEMAPTRLPPPEGESFWDKTLLGRPKNLEDLAVRIGIFWHSYYGDKVRSLLTGLPPTYDNDETCHVTTAFPLDLEVYTSGEAFEQPSISCDSLFDGNNAELPENIQSLPLKGLTLLDYAIRFATRTFSRPQSRILLPATYELYQELNESSSLTVGLDILGLQQSLNHFRESSRRILDNLIPFEAFRTARPRGEAYKAASFRTLIRLKILATEIHLSYAMVGDDALPLCDEETAFNTRLRAAHECADVTAEAVEALIQLFGNSTPPGCTAPGIEGMCMLTGVLLAFASGVLLENINKLKVQLASQELQLSARKTLEREMQDELRRLDVISEPTERVRTTYPIVDLHWRHIEKARQVTVDATTEEAM
ncbi:hypothetical protein FRB90_006816 [Tulasnella sp. 427]|nr:hypothetical protein FRB90_006816 [Tulasnella sp. 427]